jgi:tetratricopeptide (TPR) repeat protein
MMTQKILLLLFFVFFGAVAHAQTAEQVYDNYLDFNVAKLNDDAASAIALAEKILPDTVKLTPKVRLAFYNSLAKLYEDDNQSINAIKYYKIVVAAQPDYYVAHRALGYLYIKDISGKSVAVNHNYIEKAGLALPHLEKAQACDPDENTLKIIKVLYNNLNNEAALGTLPARLAKLSKNCIDLLSDQ